MKKILILSATCCLFLYPLTVLAQKATEIERAEEQIEREKQLREKIEIEREVPQIEEPTITPQAVPAAAEKALIEVINVTGATLLAEEEINTVISSFENKELTLAEMQKVADLITEAYRNKGYVTSRAYLPPQKIREGILEIRVVEGVTGDIRVQGIRFFSSTLMKKNVRLVRGYPFNYNTLSDNLSRINEHPDRNVKAVLVPGREPGTTDIILEVKDRFPVHVNLGWDNFGSRYIRKNHYISTFIHNNLLGFDDIFSLQYQRSEGDDYRFFSLRYLYPAADKFKIGFSASDSKLKLGKEYRDVLARGKSRVFGLYGVYELIRAENINLALNLGFDYKDSFNFQANLLQSRDRLRIGKIGFDLDFTDQLRGRTIISPEFDFGFSSIMGGLEAKDSRASRSGAGGRFIKNTITLLRLQKMPFSSNLLWRNEIQISPYILTATEQFQLGGIANVRGYPPAEYVGDKGYAMTWEWSFPPYLIPKTINVPFTQQKLYDALRLVVFYDWGNVRLYRLQAGEKENKTLRSIGGGLRFNLPENFSLRLDFAWPLDGTPSDGDNFHPWVQLSKDF